jgi:excinuclease UvrABC nuclease subunit
MTAKTIEERVVGLVKSQEYQNLREKVRALRENRNDENIRLMTEDYNRFNELFSAEFRDYLKGLYDSGQLIGITTDEQIRAKTQEEYAKFVKVARVHLPIFVKILEMLQRP